MHDIKWIREEPKGLVTALTRRGTPESEAQALVDGLIELDNRRREGIAKLEGLQARRNAASKEIGAAKKAKEEAAVLSLLLEVENIKKDLPEWELKVKAAEAELHDKLSAIPNAPLPAPIVPDGKDEHDNVEIDRVGAPRSYAFTPKQHFEIGEALGQMDFEAAAKLSGARFVVLKSQLARLERAIGQFFINTHVDEHGLTEVAPPVLVKDEAMFGTAQLPKFRDDQFAAGDDFWLIPTSEVPLTNLVAQSILSEEELPMRLTALTPCFRAEAGSAGRDTRGMIRQHQFNKVEMVTICTPETSLDEQERMLACAQNVLKKLDLPHRVVTLCTGDMGFASARTFDIEVWLPGQNAYREISSVSTCTDFQARRMNARYRAKDAKAPRYVHTLNGSGVAVGRALVAILETYQNEDGSVNVPDVLVPYMGGLTRIGG